jgi:hypothetical protein
VPGLDRDKKIKILQQEVACFLAISKRWPYFLSCPYYNHLNFLNSFGKFYLSLNKKASIRNSGIKLVSNSFMFKGLIFIIFLIMSCLNPARAENKVSVVDFGAGGNDLEDDSKAFQTAINIAVLKHAKVFVPAGNYFVSDVNLKSNITIYGEGNTSVINKIFTGIFAMGCNFSYNDKHDKTSLNKVKNLTVFGLAFKGTSPIDGFSEHKHLLNLNGVDNAVVRDCSFYAFNGDAIYIGSGVQVEKHNRNVTIIRCYFNGVNKQNRNAISVIDGDSITIAKNTFFNCTSYNMPGAVDIEPDANNYHVIKNISLLIITLIILEVMLRRYPYTSH